MPKDPVLRLKFQSANPLNKDLSWDDPEFCESPASFAKALTRLLFVDAGEFSKIVGVIRSSSRPSSDDTNKIWAKTSAPQGVGIYSDGQWIVSYSYPQDTPFLWDKSKKPIASYVNSMSSSEISAAGLNHPDNSDKWEWVIFTPPSYT